MIFIKSSKKKGWLNKQDTLSGEIGKPDLNSEKNLSLLITEKIIKVKATS